MGISERFRIAIPAEVRLKFRVKSDLTLEISGKKKLWAYFRENLSTW